MIVSWHKVLIQMAIIMAMPVAANAAGTYYTGSAYQPAQYRYGQTGTYASSYGRTNNVQNTMTNVGYNTYSQPSVPAQQKTTKTGTKKGGFFANAGITHENAMWQFEMNESGSLLHYDNLAWNVFDLNAGYVFGLGNTKVQVDAGVKYGAQWGETSMVDDDITNGGFGAREYPGVGSVDGHALAIGTSKDGNMFGFNVGFGLTDAFKMGNIKITPSIGYRYLQYKLKTQNAYGMQVYTVNNSNGCVGSNGESICGVALLFYQNETDDTPSAVVASNNLIDLTGLGGWYLNTTDTFYYTQSGTSHSYDAVWSGPYVALDMVYDINQNNSVDGRVELGFPGYTSTGDQPYRWDWAHPKSVEDSADMFSAIHFGMGANWKTAITNSVWLSLGVTYDYYSVSGADATTYINKDLYNRLLAAYNNDETALLDPNIGDQTAIYLDKVRQDCDGWVCKASKEVDSFYKSMGVRVGIDARF